MLIIIVGNLNQAQLAQWGWRVPLLMGAVTAFVVRVKLTRLSEGATGFAFPTNMIA